MEPDGSLKVGMSKMGEGLAHAFLVGLSWRRALAR